MRAAGEHHVGLAAADQFGGLADRLARGSAGREAVDVRALGVEHAGEMAGGHIGLLLDLGKRVQSLQAKLGEAGDVERLPVDGLHHHGREGVEILLAFAAAEVNPEPGGIVEAVGETGIGHRPHGSAGSKLGVAAAVFPVFRGVALVGDVPVADFGRDLGGKL